MTKFPLLERADSIAKSINPHYLTDEQPLVRALADQARLSEATARAVGTRALGLVQAVRAATGSGGALDAFLRQYSLASREGVILMCLAEALLRIPDGETADRLIADKIPSGAWDEHLGDSDSLLVNASTWGLMLTGAWSRSIATRSARRVLVSRLVGKLVSRWRALRSSRRCASSGTSSSWAATSKRADARRGKEERDYRYSFDMLGEAALTRADAERYREKYRGRDRAVGRAVETRDSITARHSISIKLSALHPRYEFSQTRRVMDRALSGHRIAGAHGPGRRHRRNARRRGSRAARLSLLLVDRLLASDVTRGYAGFGLAVQAYQKRAQATLEWLVKRLARTDRRITLRLVKGAYWDSEIKRAQERGLAGYPVFTRKANTDVSYLACARVLESAGERIYPQFATHNAHTIAHVAEVFGGDANRFEFQRLHGMGAELYDSVVRGPWGKYACRVYAPVGAHEDLLPYLVRTPAREWRQHIVRQSHRRCQPSGGRGGGRSHCRSRWARACRPSALFHCRESVCSGTRQLRRVQFRGRAGRRCAHEGLSARLTTALERGACSCQASRARARARRCSIRQTPLSTLAAVSRPMRRQWRVRSARRYWPRRTGLGGWRASRGGAGTCRNAYEEHTAALVARCVREAARTLPDAIGEVREAVTSCATTRREHAAISHMRPRCPAPRASATCCGCVARVCSAASARGTFPLAIYTGQIAAALAAGNAVVAKPAEQRRSRRPTPTGLLLQAGVPPDALHFVPGDGAQVGGALTRDPRLAGVCSPAPPIRRVSSNDRWPRDPAPSARWSPKPADST
jgi:RHH-type proline utilization regulon transcriptional repressor/proline dehydrogenase/delta 1-pyrroline-5-carboxylate dehydrogenase